LKLCHISIGCPCSCFMGGMRGSVLLLYNKGVKYKKSMPGGAILFTLILLSFKHHCTSDYLIYFTHQNLYSFT
jgi:hypothetical protein